MNPFQEHPFEDILRVGVALVVLFSGVIAVLYSIWGGFLLITSGGTEEKIKPAVNHIRHALLGLLALIIIIFVAPKVLDFFGLPYADAIRPTRIFQTIKELSYTVFGSTSSGTDNVFAPEGNSDSLPADFSDL